MSKKLRVGVIFGGKSGEHEVSIRSAHSIMNALQSEQYEVLPIGITKAGEWAFEADAFRALQVEVPTQFLNHPTKESNVREPNVATETVETSVVPTDLPNRIDVVMPVLHGSYGEDGTIQGLLEMLDVPYVGAGVLASAVGMDKVMMKRIFKEAGLPQCEFESFLRSEWERNPGEIIDRIETNLGYPCFIKPANLGSSVGISKAKTREQLEAAIHLAAQYDRKIIVEEGLEVREVEVAVLGNEQPIASVAGEITPSNEFYDYHAKYIGGESELMIPAAISDSLMQELRDCAVKAFTAIDCSGLARVDFFVEKATDRVLLNEINTMPGFTVYSMYPKLWEATGISFDRLIQKLLDLAIERHQEKQRNKTDFTLES